MPSGNNEILLPLAFLLRSRSLIISVWWKLTFEFYLINKGRWGESVNKVIIF